METKIKTAQQAKNDFFNFEITLEELIDKVNSQIIPVNYTLMSREKDDRGYRIVLPFHIPPTLIKSLKIECEKEWNVSRCENSSTGNFVLTLEFKKEA